MWIQPDVKQQKTRDAAATDPTVVSPGAAAQFPASIYAQSAVTLSTPASGQSSTSAVAAQQIEKLIAQLQKQLAAIEAKIASSARASGGNADAVDNATTQLGAQQQQASSVQAALSQAESALMQAVKGAGSGSGAQTNGTTT